MPERMVPDQIMKALDFAEFVVAKEERDRVGSSDACVLPMKFFLFHEQKSITGLMGLPFETTDLDEKEQMSLAVRLFALALDAKAVLHVTEAWIAKRCASCGTEEPWTAEEGKCKVCGQKMVAPSENPYAEEMLVCTLSARHHEKAYFWMSRFERNETGKLLRFREHLKCQPMDAGGRFTQVWSFERWMAPHFAVNYPAIRKALGKPVEDKFVEAARIAEKMAPPNYPFIRLNVEDLQAVVTRMRLKTDAEKN